MSVEKPDALILAGGQGRRMGGVCKARLELASGQSVLGHMLEAIAPVVGRCFVVAPPGLTLLATGDPAWTRLEDPGTGPANAMVTGARAAKTDRVFVLAADLPGLGREILTWLESAETSGAAAVIPVHGGRAQPLVGLYDRARLAQLDLESGASVHEVLGQLGWHGLSSDVLSSTVARGLDGFNTWAEAETWGIRRGSGLANGAGPRG